MQGHRHLIWIILPVLPVLLGFAALNIINDGSIRLLADAVTRDALYEDSLDLRFYNALIIFVPVGLFQVLGCVAVAIFAGLQVWDAPAEARRKSLLVFAGSVVLVILISVAARQDGFSGAINLAYRTTCAMLVDVGLATQILPGTCKNPGISDFAWFGLLPYMAGILAAAAASAAVSTAHQQQSLADWADLVEQAFKATAFVLVASTVAMMLFYYLPVSVVEHRETKEMLSGFAQGMTLFWGIVFSLTLLAVFGPAHLLLSRAVAQNGAVSEDLRKGLADRSTAKQAARVLTTLAPLLVGSSASVIEMLTGAFAG